MRWSLPLVATLTLSACFFQFDRFTELLPGDIAGRVVREDGSAAAYSHVRVEGAGRLFRTDGEGRFLIRGLAAGAYALRFSDDENGDGLIERAAVRVVALNVVSHADGLFGADSRLSFVSLGDVELDGVVEVNGLVVDEQGDPVPAATIGVARDAQLPEAFLDADGTQRNATLAELSLEAKTTSRADGTFSLRAVAAGEFKVVAVLPVEDEDAAVVSAPRDVVASAGDVVNLVVTPLELLPPPPSERAVQLELAPPPDERVKLHLAEPKTDVAPRAPFADFNAEPELVFPGAPSIPTTIPFGLHSVFVGTEDGRIATMGVHLASRPGEDLVIWGTGLLSEEDVCPQVLGGRDCDRDGAREIPPGNRVTQAILLRCTDACFDAFGSARGDATCEVAGVTYDCDDDGDGQPDMTEPPACRTLFAGGDWDHDGLCALDDPFDDCVTNDPSDPACGAGTDGQDPPPIAPEYDGVDYFEDRFDGGPPPGDAGPADDDAGFDGGPTPDDAGPPDAGSPDAGDDDAGVFVPDGGQTDAGPTVATRTALPDNGFVDIFAGVYTIEDATRAGDGFAVAVTGSSGIDLGPACQLTTANGFVALFDGDGLCLWARTWTLAGNNTQGFNSAFPTAVTGLPDGSVAVGGQLTGSVGFDGSGAVTLSAESEDGFVVVYDAAGDTLVGRTMPSTANGKVVGIEALANAPGDVFVMGDFGGTLDLAGGTDPALAASAAGSSDAYVARLGLDLRAAWLKPLGATTFSSALAGGATASGTTEYAVVAGRFAGTLLPGEADRTAAAGPVYVATVYDDGVLQGWATFDGLGFERISVTGSRARGRVVLTGNVPGGGTYTVTDVNDTTASPTAVTEPRWVVQELTHDCRVTRFPLTLTANDADLRVSDVAMDDRGVLYAGGQITGSVTASGTTPLGLDTGSVSAARAFVVSWRPTLDDPTLDAPLGSVVGVQNGAGDVQRLVPLADDRVFALGDIFTDATFEATAVPVVGSPSFFSWRLSDGLADRQLVVDGDSWVKALAPQRDAVLVDAVGRPGGGFALVASYDAPGLPLELGGACAPLDSAGAFAFVAAFDAGGACEWARIAETAPVTDAGPGGASPSIEPVAIAALTSGEIVGAFNISSAAVTWGDDEDGVEQVYDPVPSRDGVTAHYRADGALKEITIVRSSTADLDLEAMTATAAGGYAISGSGTGTLFVDPFGSNLSVNFNANPSFDAFFASFSDLGQPNWVRTADSEDAGTLWTAALVEADDQLVVAGYGSGDMFPVANQIVLDNQSVWIARMNTSNGVLTTTSVVTGVYSDALALAASPGGGRYVVAVPSGYNATLDVRVENPAGATVLTEPGRTGAMTVMAFFDASTGDPVSHAVVRGSTDDDTVAVRDLSFLSDTDLWVSGYAYNGVQFDNNVGGTTTFPSMFTDMAFALRFADQGSDTWQATGGGRTFVGAVVGDGATTLADTSLLLWGQVYDDARFISWDWFQPGTGNPPFDFLWFVPLDLDE